MSLDDLAARFVNVERQNAWIDSFNGRLRDEFLNGWQLDSLHEARGTAQSPLRGY